MTTETIVLDPNEFAPSRTELALDDLGLRISKDGADWGESQVAIQLAKAQNGAAVTDRRLEPVEMSIPLQVKEDGAAFLADAAHRLQQKAGIFQANEREPNWIRRDFDDGGGFAGSVGYMVYSAALHGLQGWLMAHRQHAPEVTLKLLRSPLCYATTEVESDYFEETADRVLEWEIDEMLGTGPGLIRLRVDNLNASDHWRGLIVPYESRDHPQDASAATTAKLTYEAEDLTLRGGSTEAERSGDSGNVVRHSSLTAGWLTILSSEIDGVGHMTHVGVRRLWARVYDPGTAGSVELRLQFRPLGSLQWSSTGVTVPTPLADAFALVDLGECRPEPAVIGDQRWEWRLQARAPSGAGEIDIDQIHVCPVEHYTVVTAPDAAQAADTQSTKSPGTVESKEGTGTVAWSNPSNAKASDNSRATATLGIGAATRWLMATNPGFALPEGATVLGIMPSVERSVVWKAGNPLGSVVDSSVRIVQGGAIAGSPHPVSTWPRDTDATAVFGGASELWGLPWTAAQINNSGFGFAIAALAVAAEFEVRVDHIKITVFYTEADDENRVCFAERSIEFRSDGVYRQHPEDDVWGVVTPEGFYPQAPPSWLEGRAVRGLVIPTQGDLDTIADAGTNKVGLTVLSRAGYHFAREAV